MKSAPERCVFGTSGEVLEKRHLERYKFALPYVSAKKVLDIGCGTGYALDLIACKASQIVAIDICQEAVNYARQHCKRKNIEFHVPMP